MLEGQIDEEQKIEKPAQSERHSRKTEASEGRQKLPRPHMELSRKPRSSLKRVVLGALRDFANETGMGHTEIAHELGISPAVDAKKRANLGLGGHSFNERLKTLP